jgi:hypothetical protein
MLPLLSWDRPKQKLALEMLHMVIGSKRTGLAGAVVILASAGPAHAIEAHYTCGNGARLTAKFSPPGTAKGMSR